MPKRKKINRFLFVADLTLGFYLIAAPLFPGWKYYFSSKPTTTREVLAAISAPLPGNKNSALGGKSNQSAAPENGLIIPEIGVNGQIYEGPDQRTLAKGIWHRPGTATPASGGNVVLVAHRYLYTFGPNTFYNLDKIKVGDQFAIVWQGVKYLYQVYSVSVVAPTDLSIEAPTIDPIATLYTCTPLFVANQRLVVRANLIGQL